MSELFESVIKLLDLSMPVPQPYGIFHICFVLLTACICFLLCRFLKAPGEKAVRRVLLIYALVCIAFEVIKQLSFTFDVTDSGLTANYQWYAFPFQLCSVPMYVALLGALIPNRKFHQSCTAFLATYSMIAGVMVMATAGTVFIDTICVNIQTMVHHGLQTAVGLFLLIRAGACEKPSRVLGGAAVFLTAVAIALILNITMVHIIPEGEVFNMFFISPHFESTLPVYCDLWKTLPYPIFILAYTVPFIAASFLIYIAIYPIPRLIKSFKN